MKNLKEILNLHLKWVNSELGGVRAYLRDANLRYAYLRDANLSGADLRYANLSGANLSGANLRDAYIPMYCKWSHSLNGDKLYIGCKTKTIKEWTKWFKSDEVYSTQRNTPEFKQIYAVFMAYKAYHKVLNDLK
jgi:hypothetical protein